MIQIIEELGWTYCRASIRDTGGPTRVHIDDEPDPTFKPRAVGFTAQIEPVEVEPLLWDGDGA